MSTRVRFVVPCLLLVAAALCGCHTAPPPTTVQTNGPVPSPPPVADPGPVAPTPPSPTPIKEAVTGLLAQPGDSHLPKGTQLLGVKLDNGVATLDFSKEFNALANSGDSTESEAQKALQATLAKFPEVQKMRVTVEGKPFDSQNTDWTTPFAVRNDPAKPGGEGQGGGQ